jgi:hypothetical protein
VDKTKPFGITKREAWEAYKQVKANQGTAGVDGQSIDRSGMQIDSAVVSVLVEVSSFKSIFGKHDHTKRYAQGGGLNEYQGGAADPAKRCR